MISEAELLSHQLALLQKTSAQIIVQDTFFIAEVLTEERQRKAGHEFCGSMRKGSGGMI